MYSWVIFKKLYICNGNFVLKALKLKAGHQAVTSLGQNLFMQGVGDCYLSLAGQVCVVHCLYHRKAYITEPDINQEIMKPEERGEL